MSLTFEEYCQLNTEPRHELVNGELVPLPGYGLVHGWAKASLIAEIRRWMEEQADGRFCGPSVDIPTGPASGRCPDVIYYDPVTARERLDWVGDRVLGVPVLVAEITSRGFEARDWIDKREEYAAAGIKHYWILDPEAASLTTMCLADGEYQVQARVSGEDVCTSVVFLGLRIPLRRLFDVRHRRSSGKQD